MDYKEKYEQALENLKKIKNANKDNKSLVDFIEYEYPELKESEDEKIRKEIIQSIKDNMIVIHKDKCIAWLEKQGEQKHSWSEEDERHKNTIIHAIHGAGNITPIDGELAEKWLISLKQRMKGK